MDVKAFNEFSDTSYTYLEGGPAKGLFWGTQILFKNKQGSYVRFDVIL